MTPTPTSRSTLPGTPLKRRSPATSPSRPAAVVRGRARGTRVTARTSRGIRPAPASAGTRVTATFAWVDPANPTTQPKHRRPNPVTS